MGLYNYNRYYKEKSLIEYHTVILCQSIEDISKAQEWLKSQNNIKYLPKKDHFAYYCPMCNCILKFGDRCRNMSCNQAIDWDSV